MRESGEWRLRVVVRRISVWEAMLGSLFGLSEEG